MLTEYKGYTIETVDKGNGFTRSFIFNKNNELCGGTFSSSIGEQSIDKAKKRIDKPETLKEPFLTDDLDPVLIFSKVNTLLLTKIVKGELDLKKLAELELFDRDLDINGKSLH